MDIKELFKDKDMTDEWNQTIYTAMSELQNKVDDANNSLSRLKQEYNQRFFQSVETSTQTKPPKTLPPLSLDIMMDKDKYNEYKKNRDYYRKEV